MLFIFAEDGDGGEFGAKAFADVGEFALRRGGVADFDGDTVGVAGEDEVDGFASVADWDFELGAEAEVFGCGFDLVLEFFVAWAAIAREETSEWFF